MPYFYIYKMTHLETGEFYIGRRTSNLPPEEDIKYRGSSRTWYQSLSKKEIDNVLIKNIIKTCSSMLELCEVEIDLIKENIKNPLCKNSHIPSVGFRTKGPHKQISKNKMSSSRKGKVSVMDEHGNFLTVDVTDDRYISGMLVGVNSGKIVVKDSHGKTHRISVDDERYKNGELIPVSKGKVTVKDQMGNFLMVDIEDHRYVSGELKPLATGNTPWNKGNIPIEEYKDGALIKVWKNLTELHEETKIPKSSIVNWIKKGRNNSKGYSYKYKH